MSEWVRIEDGLHKKLSEQLLAYCSCCNGYTVVDVWAGELINQDRSHVYTHWMNIPECHQS